MQTAGRIPLDETQVAVLAPCSRLKFLFCNQLNQSPSDQFRAPSRAGRTLRQCNLFKFSLAMFKIASHVAQISVTAGGGICRTRRPKTQSRSSEGEDGRLASGVLSFQGTAAGRILVRGARCLLSPILFRNRSHERVDQAG